MELGSNRTLPIWRYEQFEPAVEAAEHQSEPAALPQLSGRSASERGPVRALNRQPAASARTGKLSSSGITTATRRAVSTPPMSAIDSASHPCSRSQCLLREWLDASGVTNGAVFQQVPKAASASVAGLAAAI